MCLWDQGIDDDNGVIESVIRACRIRDNDGGVDRRRGIDNASEGLETTAEASRIQGRQPRLRRRDDGTEELATTTEALSEEDGPEVLMTTTEASTGEA